MGATALIDFGERVKALREARSLSQGDVAEKAGLTPASLSRLLSGDRTLRMDQAVALARALGVSVIELTQGTTAEGVVSGWVPRAEFDQADRGRAEAEREVDLARAEGEARTAEVNALRESVRTLTARAAELEGEVVRLRADAARAEELSRLNADLNRQVHGLQAEATRSRMEAASFKNQAGQAIELANRNFAAWQSAMSQLHAVQGNLTKAKSETVAVGVVTAALAGLAGAMLATPATTSRGRSRG
jgi:transcriptional regulator with XRE-family HTH domain